MSMIAPIILVRLLDQADYGYYRKIVLVLTVVGGVLSMSLPESLYYFVSKAMSSCQRLVVRTAWLLLGFGLLGGVLMAVLAPWLQRMFEVPLMPYLPWLVVYVVLSVPSALAYALPTIDQRAQLQAMLLVVIETMRTVFLTIAVILTGSLDFLVMALCLYVMIKFAAMAVYVSARGRAERARVDESPSLREQFAYAMPLWGAGNILLIRDQGHAFFVAGMFNSVEFAIYAVGTLAIPVLPFVNEIIGNVMLIQAARRYRERDLAEMRRIWFRSMHNLALALIPVFIVLEVFAHDLIVTVFGADYVQSVGVFRVYIVCLLSWIPLLCSPLLKATGDTKLHLFADIVSTVGTVGVLLVGTKFWGLYLAALSPAAGYLLFALAASGTVGRRMGLGRLQIYPFRSMAKIAVCALVSCVLPWAALLGFNEAIRLFVGGPLAGLLFGVVAWRFDVIESSEKELVRTSVRRILPSRAAEAIVGWLDG